jgi:membrane protease subunit (stomatin/prohibitin family)
VDSPSVREQYPALRASQFGQVLVEVDAGGSWVHSVAWSPSGSALAFCSHDACVRFLQGLTFQQQASEQGPQQQQQQQQVGRALPGRCCRCPRPCPAASSCGRGATPAVWLRASPACPGAQRQASRLAQP